MSLLYPDPDEAVDVDHPSTGEGDDDRPWYAEDDYDWYVI